MEKHVAEMLSAALRSGDYAQYKGGLGRYTRRMKQPRYCVLGVLCELYMNNDGYLNKQIHPSGEISYDGKNSASPFKVADWAGLGYQMPLANLNDEKGMTFPKLADYIDANWKEL